MPEGDIKPFDSYAKRLEGQTKGAAEQKKVTDAKREAEAPTPFDSYAGRLDKALDKASGEEVEELPPVAEEEVEEAAPAEDEAYQARETGPMGTGDYVVKQGDCISSIAMEAGYFPDTIWHDSANTELREIRKDPNVLLPGDRVTIPPLRRKEEPGETEMEHRFRRKGMPSMLRVHCLRFDEPLANLPYSLDVDGKLFSGQTDADGRVEHPIPPDAKRGLLVVKDGSAEYEYEFELGQLDPLDSTTGIKARLANLGFDPGPIDTRDTPEYRAALREFQEKYGLDVTGEPDRPTRGKLSEFAI